MSDGKVSQVREVKAGWKKMVDDHVARLELAYAEVARLQEQALTQNRQAIEEMAKLQRDSVDYFGQLSSSFFKLTLDATRKVADLVTPSSVAAPVATAAATPAAAPQV
jgi:hypothetical protein